MGNRPSLVLLIGILLCLAGAVMFVTGFLLETLTAEMLTDIGLDPAKFGESDAYLYLIIGVITILVGGLILTGWTFAWYVAVIVLGAQFLWQGYKFVAISATAFTAVTVVLSAVLLYYIFRPKVRKFFSV